MQRSDHAPQDEEALTDGGKTADRKTLRIMIAGGEAAGVRCLQALAATDHHIVGVLASANRTTTAGIEKLAREKGLQVWPGANVKDAAFAETVSALGVDVLLNIHSLHIVRREILHATKLGGYNLHPGPLPRLAGLNAPSWALFGDHKVHGVTLHKMDDKIDSGPIVYQSNFPITETDTALSLMSKCVSQGLPLVMRLVEELARDPNSVPLAKPGTEKLQYFGREVPNGGQLSWASRARDVINFVRACDYYPFESPWGHPETWQGRRKIGIVKSVATGERTSDAPGSVFLGSWGSRRVACADETVEVSHVILQNKLRRASEVLIPGQILSNSPSA